MHEGQPQKEEYEEPLEINPETPAELREKLRKTVESFPQ